MELFSVIISGFSLALSIGLAVWTYTKERESYSVDIIDYRAFQTESLFLLCISNPSSCPLIITNIKYDGFACLLEPKPFETRRGVPVRATADFPLCIPAHGAQYAYVLFPDAGGQHKQLNPGIVVNFQIRTTQSLSQRTVTLSHTGYYLHKELYQ